MARPVPTFLAQQFWWLLGIDHNRMGYQRRGMWTKRRIRAHQRLRREFHVGILTGGDRLPNIIGLHIFWLNERCQTSQFSIDPDPTTVDALWIYSQDPLTSEARAQIDAAIAAAVPGTVVFNRPENHDFYHRPGTFESLAKLGVPVPRSQFSDADLGIPVVWKPIGLHSVTKGPEPYRGDRSGFRAFEYIDASDSNGLHWRYRAHFVFGEIFLGTGLGAPEPIVRYANSTNHNDTWQLSDKDLRHIRAIASTSKLDFFAVDFIRQRNDGTTVFTDINSFPVLKDIPVERDLFGYRHDFDKMRPLPDSPSFTRTTWQLVDEVVARAARHQEIRRSVSQVEPNRSSPAE